jgi:hypothetical protein
MNVSTPRAVRFPDRNDDLAGRADVPLRFG